MKQELALFLIGSPFEYFNVQEIHIQQCLALLTSEADPS
jgi:hypothetical protein